MYRLIFQLLILLALSMLIAPCDGFLSTALKEINVSLHSNLIAILSSLRLTLGALGGYLGTLCIIAIGVFFILKGLFPNFQLVPEHFMGLLFVKLLSIAMIFIIIAIIVQNGLSSPGGWSWWPQAMDYCITISIVFYVVAFLTAMNILQLFLALFIGEKAAASAIGGVLSSTIIGIYMWLLYKPIKNISKSLKNKWGGEQDDD